MKRSGILAAGNFIVDHVKIIDTWPEQDALASILSESAGNGGGPYNILKDLRALGAAYPLAAAGLVGADADGKWIREDCAAAGIDTNALHIHPSASTSYTDAMTARDTGRRTFFHQRGANALFDGTSLPLDRVPGRIFYLGYLHLLDELDQLQADGSTKAAGILRQAVTHGWTTAVDLVSASHPRFADVIRASLPWTDILFLNEKEAGRFLGSDLAADDFSAMKSAAEEILSLGVRSEVVLHSEKGVAVAKVNADTRAAAAPVLSPECIRGATGAGDAFAAGWLHARHEGWNDEDTIALATGAAISCLRHPTASGGVAPIEECLTLGADTRPIENG